MPSFVPDAQPNASSPFREFPIEVFPPTVRAYVISAAATIGCSTAYIAVPLLATLAAAIGNTRRVRLNSTWIEPCILWAAIIGESGSLKTPALSHATDSLTTRQEDLWNEHRRDQRRHEDEQAQYQRDLRLWQNASDTPRPIKPDPAVLTRYTTTDATVPALTRLLADQPRGLLLINDELSGWLQSLNRSSSGTGDVAKYLEMHGGKCLTVDRKTGRRQTTFVPHASLSIAGGIQPEVLKAMLGSKHFDNGLAARFLMTDPPVQQQGWPTSELDIEVTKKLKQIVDKLLDLQFAPGPSNSHEPIVYDLAESARAHWIRFVDEHGLVATDLPSPRHRSAFSKLKGAAARLALILQCVSDVERTDATPGNVDATSVKDGITLANWFWYETQRIYARLAESPKERQQRELIDYIQSHGGVTTARELQRSRRCYRTAEEAELALTDLVQLGAGAWQTASVSSRAGRPSGRQFALYSSDAVDKIHDFTEKMPITSAIVLDDDDDMFLPILRRHAEKALRDN